ncbi:SPOR domain-containing protein [bacterium]|nr:SPOR domain-containing protein [bacterium]
MLTIGVLIVVGISFSLGLFTGWRFARPQGEEIQLPTSRPSTTTAQPYKPNTTTTQPVPPTPIFIIPNRPSPPQPQKPRTVKTQPEIPIKPSTNSEPTNIPTTPPTQTQNPSETTQKETTTKETTTNGKSPGVEQKLFKVTIGPLDEEKAKKLQDEFNKEGKQAILVPTNGKFKLQLGAFLQKENAQQLADELKSKGYNPSIEER